MWSSTASKAAAAAAATARKRITTSTSNAALIYSRHHPQNRFINVVACCDTNSWNKNKNTSSHTCLQIHPLHYATTPQYNVNSQITRRPFCAYRKGKYGRMKEELQKAKSENLTQKELDEERKRKENQSVFVYDPNSVSKFPLPNQTKERPFHQLTNEILKNHQMGDYKMALKLSEKLIRDTTNYFAGKGTALKRDQHPAIASAYCNAGLFHKLLGNWGDSRKAYQKALKLYKSILGPDHSSVATVLHNMGTLNRLQLQVDDGLKASDRKTLLEESLEYMEQAYKIRVDERGPLHPQTVASRSGWGASCASNILQYYKQQEAVSKSSSNEEIAAPIKPFYVLTSEVSVTEEAWKAAEEHLRDALQTALQNPRGRRLEDNKDTDQKKETVSIGEEGEVKSKAPTRMGRKMQIQDVKALMARANDPIHLKLQQEKKEKERKQKEAEMVAAATSSTTEETTTTPIAEEKLSLISEESPSKFNPLLHTMQTLSAAAAGQNLAIFLKTKATTFVAPPPPTTDSSDNNDKKDNSSNNNKNNNTAAEKNTTDGDKNDIGKETTADNKNNENKTEITEDAAATRHRGIFQEEAERKRQEQALLFEEAEELYQKVLQVRREMLVSNHPDVIATMHSQAELLSAMDREEEANVIRQKIIDDVGLDPEDVDGGGGGDENKDGSGKDEKDVATTESKGTTDAANESENAEREENQFDDEKKEDASSQK